MATTSPEAYKVLTVNGPVSIERVSGPKPPFYVILLMGPTGAGKSTFIESLGLTDAEKISSNKLEGFTQGLSTYRLNGVTYGDIPNYLVDSPGFADTKISEMAIVAMLQNWIEEHGNFNVILYLTPVTQVRLPGSLRQVLKTFNKLTGADTAKNITIVSTMWDSIAGERAMTRAEGTHRQLKDEIWKEFIEEGARMVKFHNTQGSALSVLDEALHEGSAALFNIEKDENTVSHQSPFAESVYSDLQSRIESQRQQIFTTKSELEWAEAQGDHLLRSFLVPRLEEARKYLEKFEAELQDFGPPPPGFHSAHPVSVSGQLCINGGEDERDKIRGYLERGALVEGDSGSTVDAAVQPMTSPSVISQPLHTIASDPPAALFTTANIPPSSLPVDHQPVGSSDAQATMTTPSVSRPSNNAHECVQPPHGRFSRAMGLIISCGCCGRAVEANHDV